MTTDRAMDAYRQSVLAIEQSKYLHGFIGRIDSSAVSGVVIDVPGRPGYVYVRIVTGGNSVTVDEAYNEGAMRNPNIMIRMERRARAGLVIIGAESSSAVAVLGDRAPSATVPPHSHAIASGNPDMVEGLRFVPGVIRLSDLGGLYVYAEPFQYDGGYWPGGNLALTPPGTANQQAWCVVAFDPATGTLSQFTGAEYALPVLLGGSELAQVNITAGYIPLGGVVLQNGQTAITGAEVWGDLRYHFAQAGGDISGVVLIAPESSTRNVIQPTGDYTPLTVKGDASQTDTLFEAQDSSGTVLAKIAADGDITAPDITATGTATSVTLDVNGSGTIQKLLTDASTELTIASGAVTVTQTFHRIDTESDAASDDLTTINGGADGQFLVIRAENGGREVVVTTAGNITTSDGNNVALDEVYKFLLLIYDGNRSKWNVVGGGGGGGSGSYYQTVKDNGSAMTQRAALNLIGGTDITLTIADDAGNGETDVTIAFTGSGSGSTPYSLCQGRLTLTSGTPVTTSDVTAAGTLYFTPYKGNQIGLYDGSGWDLYAFSELSLALTGYTADKNYDIWAYDNSGTVTLDSTVWTDDTTRATALTTQDGVYVKSGATTRRYLGTIRITGTTGQTEDSLTKRFVWNYYNRVGRPMAYSAYTYHSYNGNYRSWNNSTTHRIHLVVGETTTLTINMTARLNSNGNSGRYAFMGLGMDSTSSVTVEAPVVELANWIYATRTAYKNASTGYHYLQALESSGSSGSSQFGGFEIDVLI